MAEEAKEVQAVEKQPKSFGTLKLIIAGVVIIILAAGLSFGVAMFAFKSVANEDSAAKGDGFGKVKSETLGFTFDAGEYVTNLANEGGGRFIKVRIVLAFPDAAMAAEIENKIPEIQHNINISLRANKVEDLAKPQAMEKLAEELKNNINGLLLKGNISSVYFTSFVVQ